MAKWRMKLYTDIEITTFPPRGTGMQPGVVPAGVRVEHKPTGSAVEVKHYRSQHKNKAAALAALALLIEDAVREVTGNQTGKR